VGGDLCKSRCKGQMGLLSAVLGGWGLSSAHSETLTGWVDASYLLSRAGCERVPYLVFRDPAEVYLSRASGITISADDVSVS
jgi:hypothetical protein